MRSRIWTVPVFGSLILAGCGGGGSDSQGSGTTPLAPSSGTPQAVATASINRSNAADVAAQSFSSGDALGGQAFTGTSLLTGVEVTAQGDAAGVVGASIGLLHRAIDARPVDLVTGVTTSNTSACTGGGSISATTTFAVSGKVSNGDSMVISASNCLSNGLLFNGSTGYVFSNLSGTIGSTTAWSASIALTYNNLSLSTNGETLRLNGDLSMSYSQSGYRVATANVNGNSLQMTLLRNGAVVVDRTLSKYSTTASVAGNNGSYSNNFTLSGNLPRIGNFSYTVNTSTPFHFSSASPNPTSGVMTVTAPDRGSVRLTALDSTNVRLDIDQNGDGVIDETVATTWSDLKSRI